MIKKILFGAAVAMSLVFTGCVEKNDTYEKLKPVQGGILIYNGAMNQNVVALQQANFAVRLGILLAEAEKQPDVEKLEDLVVKNRNVKNALLGSAAIEKLDNGDYKLTFKDNVADLDAYARKGVMMIHTNGKAQLSETTEDARWRIEFVDGLKMTANSSSGTSTITTTGGTTTIYNDAGTLHIVLDGLRCYYDSYESMTSNWGGSFTLRPDADSFAYSDCAGKKFVFSGAANGVTFNSYDGRTATSMSLLMTDGEYYSYSQSANYSTLAITGGTINARLLSVYDPAAYPSDKVTVVWNNGVATIEYNGHTQTI